MPTTPTPARSDEAQQNETAEPTPLRWGLNDVMWGDDDTTTIMLSGPTGEPYWLELDPDRAAALRRDLAGPDSGEHDEAQQPAAGAVDLPTLAAALDDLHTLIATSSRDWQTYRVDAWIWAVICGWDCEQTEHDDTCTHGALEETAAMHGWNAATVAKARRHRAAVRRLADEQQQDEAAPLVTLATPCAACGHTRNWHYGKTCTVTPSEPCNCPGFTTT